MHADGLRVAALALALALGFGGSPAIARAQTAAADQARPEVVEGAAGRTVPIVTRVGEVTFRVDAPRGMERFARLAADVVEAHWEAINGAVGGQGAAEVEVAVEREIGDWFERRGVPPRNPEWAAGLAIYSEMAVLVKSSVPDWEATLRHELAHIAIDLAAGGNPVPRWFNEGLAVATAEQWSLERATTMIRAGLTGSFYTFEELTPGFPAAASSADLAYAQSLHFLQYVQRSYGERVFVDVLASVRAGMGWDDAFALHVGATQTSVEAAWSTYVKARYRWAPAATGGGGAWGLATVVGVVAWRRKRRIKMEQLRAMGDEERRLYSPDPDDVTFG